MLRLLVVVSAARPDEFIDVAREKGERDDEAEEAGAKEAHERES